MHTSRHKEQQNFFKKKLKKNGKNVEKSETFLHCYTDTLSVPTQHIILGKRKSIPDRKTVFGLVVVYYGFFTLYYLHDGDVPH